jgi:hypothetical protein
MADIFLIHWNEAEAQERAARIRAMGYDVRTESSDGARGGKAILANPPAAVVVDLSRLPSHGRKTAHYLHYTKAGRGIPIVFLPGDPAKMVKVRQAVPGAVWSSWETLSDTLKDVTGAPTIIEVGTKADTAGKVETVVAPSTRRPAQSKQTRAGQRISAANKATRSRRTTRTGIRKRVGTQLPSKRSRR